MRFFRSAGFALALLAAAFAPGIGATIPIHGTALGPGPNGTTIVRTDAVTGMVPAQTRAYRISPKSSLPPGTQIDAFLGRASAPWTLYDTTVAAKFVPGLPESGKVFPIDYGSRIPAAQLVDQNGTLIRLANDFRGKAVLISFIFTRCPDKDECPAVSAKFAALAQRLDPRRFHLVEITLDPVYDSPWVLHRYAALYGARASSWSIVTGQQHEIQHLLDRFGISSLRTADARFIHNDKVFLSTPDGRIADIVQGVTFTPDALAAQARHLAGLSSSPLGRFELSLVAGAAALCGGSQFGGVVLLETVTFLIIAALSFTLLGWAARRIWRRA
jgi:protein SCO1/2